MTIPGVHVLDLHPPFQACVTERVEGGLADHWFTFEDWAEVERAEMAIKKLKEVFGNQEHK